jgi:hypothetical protein
MLELVKDRDLLSGDGVKTSFDFDFYIQKDSDIEVYIIDNVESTKEKQELATNYTVTSISTNPLGFRVNFTSAVLTSDQDVFTIRKMPYTQLLNLGVVTDYDERKITNALDKLTALCQQNAKDIERCLSVADESSTTGVKVPEPDEGKTFKWGAGGSLVNSTNDPDQIAALAQTYATNASNSASAASTSESNAAASEANALDYKDDAEASALEAAGYAASLNLPNGAGNGGNYLRQKSAEDGLEYRTPKQLLTDITMDEIKYKDIQFIQFNDKKKLVIKAGTLVRLTTDTDTRFLRVDSDLVIDVTTILDTGTTLQNGKDYYVYLVPSGATDVALKVSLNSTYPTGYTSANTRKIGGFHTECVNVGTISGHPLSGWLAGDILPASIWSLSHRPLCSPEGMVFISELNVWVDIYLQSGTGINTKSAYGATVTDTRSWPDHADDMFKVGKTLLTSAEFSCAAEGSNQLTAILGSAAPTPKTSGGHLDTASRRMVSNYGLEECCGFLWQWLDHPSANGGSGWSALPGSKGQLYGSSYGMLAGGHWYDGASCGSRSRDANAGVGTLSASLGGRGRSCLRRGM